MFLLALMSTWFSITSWSPATCLGLGSGQAGSTCPVPPAAAAWLTVTLAWVTLLTLVQWALAGGIMGVEAVVVAPLLFLVGGGGGDVVAADAVASERFLAAAGVDGGAEAT